MNIKTSLLVKVALLSAIAFVLQFASMPLPFFPPFLKIDIADLPAIIAAIVLGPLPAVGVQLIKNILQAIVNSSSAGVGEFANFLIGSALVLPIGLVFKINKNIKNYLTGAILGIISMVIAACILNYFVLIPMYINVMGLTLDTIINMSSQFNPNVTNLFNYLIFIVVPFNFIKGIMITLIGFAFLKLLYKPLMKQLSE